MNPTKLKFGDFELDAAGYELSRSGRAIKLERIPMELLLLLVNRRGQLVTRDEILEKLWGKDTFLDVDNSINTAISKIRVVLKDNPESPAFIKTVSGKGYRFIASIASLPDGQDAFMAPIDGVSSASEAAVADEPALESESKTSSSMVSPGRPAVIGSLAVLPLENLTGDATQEYFADGMTDALITDLAQIGALRVISRTSVMRYKGVRKPLPEIARELGVDGIVEGTVTRSAGRIRVTSQLIFASSDQHLWAQSYERDIGDVVELQADIAQAIANEVRAALTPEQRKRLSAKVTTNPSAYEDYLKGRYYWNQRTPAGVKKSVEFFQQAVEKDPNFALAYAGSSNASSGARSPAGGGSRRSRTRKVALRF